MPSVQLFLKFYLIFGSFCNVLLGIACIILSSQAAKIDENLFPEQDQKNYKKDFCIALYVLGGVTIGVGAVGFYSFIRKQKCLQSIFIIFNIIYCAAFSAIFGITIYVQNYINKQMTDSYCQQGELGDYNTVFQQLQSVWCNIDLTNLSGSVTCPCLATNLSQWTTEELKLINSSKQAFRQDSNWIPIPTTTILECNFFIQQIAEQKAKEVTLLKAIESNFECTGICTGDLVYYFNNINSGRPANSNGCYSQIRQKLTDWAQYIYIISIIIACFSFLNILFALINCCIGSKQNHILISNNNTEEVKN
ncbi:tetraspanin family protein (macronuclear) [Tetrahymena thermophila SB210]|uniref:Tetraspanin family protein n=1 Tax=Tetrahymena thermophila (strain SB210) TaxID=312017 RepID=Q235P8_TETTS|nr:tetraspanin family protein [Tetrahymena thermophila SB210]EAR92232.2 tetraspanin family protein [Tetrahymena thermophila SB210]|eukprot:XP_001012477.2 tetraspanin family protein [Tetrahymena thermophila SB210]